MYFESIAALISMDGHGPYVWSAYGVTAVVLISLVLKPLLRKRHFLMHLRMQLRREQSRAPGRATTLPRG